MTKDFGYQLQICQGSIFFDEKWTRFVGAFDKGKLVAAFRIFFNENEYGESQ